MEYSDPYQDAFGKAMHESGERLYNAYKRMMDDMYGQGNWTSTIPEPWPKELDFLTYFLKAKIQVTADLWAKLDMKL